MNHLFRRAAWIGLLLPAFLAAQVTSSALSGTVDDPAGAVVPNAKVTLTGEGNGFVRTISTTGEGFFSFPDLTPATFTLHIEAPGFKAYQQTGILLNANEQHSLGQIRLEVGQVSESVTVSAEPVSIELASGERAGTLSGEQLDKIALRGRDILDAVSLMAGVVDTSDGRDAPGTGNLGNIYVLGGRTDQKNMTIDGVTNLDTGSNGGQHITPSMDTVAQVKVLMAAYSAESGRNPVAINVISKSGTTQFHGSAGFYFRNEDLNANDFFSNEAGKPRAEYRYDIGNYTIGGPVILPKLGVVRHKMFFFFGQEFQHQIQNYGVEEKTVPTALERAGNFSQSYNTGGVPGSLHVNDPLNNKAQFPGNIIPASRLTPLGQAILNIFPLPNFTDPNPANRYQWNYYANASEPYPRQTLTGRVDYAPTDKWQLFLNYSHMGDHQDVPYSVGTYGYVAGSMNFPLDPIYFQHWGRLTTLHSTNTISPTLFNEAAVASSQSWQSYTPTNPSLVDRGKLGVTIPQRDPALNVLNAIPDMSFSGIQNFANPSLADITPYYNGNNVYSAFDNVSKVWRTHTLKAGVYYEHTQKLQNATALTRGSVSFNQDGNNPYDANDPYGTALLGYYDSYGESTGDPQGNYQFINAEWFVQDAWKAKSNLSFDYGVRFYHDPPQYDARHQLSSFSPAVFNPASAPVLLLPAKVNGANVALNPVNGQTYSNGLVGTYAPGVGNPADGMLVGGVNGVPDGLFSVPPVSVASRFGFAWDPFGSGKTVIRGGGGVYFDRIAGNPVMNTLGPPAFYTPTQYYGTFGDIATAASSGFLSPTGTTYSLASKGHQQVVYNFNLSIQRQVSRYDLVEVGYTGSLGRHLLWERNINAVPPGADFVNLNPQNANPQNPSSALSTNFLRPYQGAGDIFLYEFANNSSYHALMATFQHRLSRGINVSASYTYSKVLDAADSYSSAVDPFLDIHSRDYGPAAFDRRHVFTTNFYWTLPKPGRATGFRPLAAIADNWILSGVVRMLTGGPVTPSYSLVNGINSPTGTPSDGARPQVVNPDAPIPQRFGPAPEPANQANVPWAIASNTPQFGNLGRNTLYGPGVNNWDLSIYRNIPLHGDRLTGQLRLESYNTFNHTQWSSYNTTAQFNSVGQMINTAFYTPNAARPPRRVQIAVRVWF